MTARHRRCPWPRARRAAAGLLLVLLAGSAPGAAARGIPWFDLELLPAPVRESLVRHRQFACGPVTAAGIPVPEEARLVFVSCHGGPYACPGGQPALGEYERQFTCPPDPTPRQIATMHLVSTLLPERLAAFYREALADGFVALQGDAGAAVPATTFVESAAGGAETPWSPKRLHLSVTATREPFLGEGYPSQVRITLSVNPPSEPRPVVRCRDFDVRSPYDRRYERKSRSRAERFCWW